MSVCVNIQHGLVFVSLKGRAENLTKQKENFFLFVYKYKG